MPCHEGAGNGTLSSGRAASTQSCEPSPTPDTWFLNLSVDSQDPRHYLCVYPTQDKRKSHFHFNYKIAYYLTYMYYFIFITDMLCVLSWDS